MLFFIFVSKQISVYAFSKSAQELTGLVLYTREIPKCILQYYTATSHLEFEDGM